MHRFNRNGERLEPNGLKGVGVAKSSNWWSPGHSPLLKGRASQGSMHLHANTLLG